MKSYFESIKEGIDRSVVNAGVKSANILEMNKIRGYIRMLEEKRTEKKVELASEVYNMYRKDSLSINDISSFCREIEIIDDQIIEKSKEAEDLKKEEDEVLRRETEAEKKKEVINCSCGQQLPMESKFCISCGNKMERICKCGKLVPEGAKFCISCGQKI